MWEKAKHSETVVRHAGTAGSEMTGELEKNNKVKGTQSDVLHATIT